MRVLLDTNILIHREAAKVVRDDIGTLFHWLDRLKYEKCIHPLSVQEITGHADPSVVKTFQAKLSSYNLLRTTAPEDEKIRAIRSTDRTLNDEIDTSLIAELHADRVDVLLTEDRGIHRKADSLSLSTRVFTIDSFLEKVTAENPELADYKVLSVRRIEFGNVDVNAPFFDTFRDDYPGFNQWFNRKADEFAYVCTAEDNSIVAFLYVKTEDPSENYSDISPPLGPAKRLKIGTLKVISNGFKLGERFLKIVFDNAIARNVEEIYVTLFRNTSDQDRLYRLLIDWGFIPHGTKTSKAGTEFVLTRSMSPRVDEADPRRSYPFLDSKARKFIVPIWPTYHTELLPDSILRTESPLNFVENRPNRNAISKVYVCRSFERNLRRGDIIIFYRTKSGVGPAHYTSVATTLGVVQDVRDGISSESEFIELCRKRSVFTDKELSEFWNYRRSNRPFVTNFLYVHSFPVRPNLAKLKEHGIISEAPRGFEPISDEAFDKLLDISNANKRLIVG